MFEIKGKIQFDPKDITKKHKLQSAWKRNVLIVFDENDETIRYYKYLLEERFGFRIPATDVFKFNGRLNDPLRGIHVTMINDIVDNDIYLQSKELFDGKEITIKYDPTLIRCNRKDDKMWWHIKVYSDDITNIRTIMGLGDPYTSAHITIGTVNPKFLDHAEYIIETCELLNIYLPIR